jgi:hypothetical protein
MAKVRIELCSKRHVEYLRPLKLDLGGTSCVEISVR